MSSVPFGAGEAGAEKTASPPLTCRDGSRPRVLLAEDSAAARVLTAALLNRMGCDVDTAEHGEEALAAMQSFSYDLVILDIEMPVMDGIVAAQEIKALGGRAAKTPIVALSAFLADARKTSVWAASFTAELAKPAGRDDLRDTVRTVLAGDVAGTVPSGTAPSGTPQVAGAAVTAGDREPVLDDGALDAVRRTVDRNTWRSLLETAVAELEMQVREACVAGATRDRESLRANAHKIAGISASFGAMRLAALAGQLELSTRTRPEEELNALLDRMRDCLEETSILLRSRQAG